MKKAHLSYLIISCLVIFQGCFGLLDPNNHNRGLIVSNYPSAANEKSVCYDPNSFAITHQLTTSEIVIDSDSALQAYFDYARYASPSQNNPNYPCKNYQPETIDFTKYTLLGNYASGACNVAFTRTVGKDDYAKQYVYSVKVRESGMCKSLGYSMNWVLVPKLPTGYRVAFQVR